MSARREQAAWEMEGREKRETVQRMFAEIAPRYDFLNGVMSFSRHRHWRAFAASLLELKSGDRALDVCTGTGDFIAPLRKGVGGEGRVVGLDFCPPMLAKAREKGVDGALVAGDACRLPVRSDSFDAVSVGWGIRNVPDIDLAHREIVRVLKPGGRFVSVDMAIPRNAVLRFGSNLVCGYVLPAIGSLFGAKKAYTYLPKSTQRFLSREELRGSMEGAGLSDVGWKDFMFGNICVHWGRKG